MKTFDVGVLVDADQMRHYAEQAARDFDRLMRDYMPKLCSIWANAAYDNTPPFGKKIPAKYDYSHYMSLPAAAAKYPHKMTSEQWRILHRHPGQNAGFLVFKRPKTTAEKTYYANTKGEVKQAAWIRTRGLAKLGWLRGLAEIGGTPLPQAMTLAAKRPMAWAGAQGFWNLDFGPGLVEATITRDMPRYLNPSVVEFAKAKADRAANASLDNFMQRLANGERI